MDLFGSVNVATGTALGEHERTFSWCAMAFVALSPKKCSIWIRPVAQIRQSMFSHPRSSSVLCLAASLQPDGRPLWVQSVTSPLQKLKAIRVPPPPLAQKAIRRLDAQSGANTEAKSGEPMLLPRPYTLLKLSISVKIAWNIKSEKILA